MRWAKSQGSRYHTEGKKAPTLQVFDGRKWGTRPEVPKIFLDGNEVVIVDHQKNLGLDIVSVSRDKEEAAIIKKYNYCVRPEMNPIKMRAYRIPEVKAMFSPPLKKMAAESMVGGKVRFSISVIWLRTAKRFLNCLLYTSPSPRDQRGSRMPSSA